MVTWPSYSGFAGWIDGGPTLFETSRRRWRFGDQDDRRGLYRLVDCGADEGLSDVTADGASSRRSFEDR